MVLNRLINSYFNYQYFFLNSYFLLLIFYKIMYNINRTEPQRYAVFLFYSFEALEVWNSTPDGLSSLPVIQFHSYFVWASQLIVMT